MLWYKSHKTGQYFLREHFPRRFIKYHHTECNNPFIVVFRECSVLILVKYDLKIPSPASHVNIWNFTIKTFSYPQYNLSCFERFITEEYYMLWSDTSPDVNTSEIRGLKRSTIALLRKAINPYIALRHHTIQTMFKNIQWHTTWWLADLEIYEPTFPRQYCLDCLDLSIFLSNIFKSSC